MCKLIDRIVLLDFIHRLVSQKIELKICTNCRGSFFSVLWDK